MDLADYDQILERVRQGQIVAIAPTVNEDGHPYLVGLAGFPTPVNRVWLARATGRERAIFALRAIHQARSHYEIA